LVIPHTREIPNASQVLLHLERVALQADAGEKVSKVPHCHGTSWLMFLATYHN